MGIIVWLLTNLLHSHYYATLYPLHIEASPRLEAVDTHNYFLQQGCTALLQSTLVVVLVGEWVYGTTTSIQVYYTERLRNVPTCWAMIVITWSWSSTHSIEYEDDGDDYITSFFYNISSHNELWTNVPVRKGINSLLVRSAPKVRADSINVRYIVTQKCQWRNKTFWNLNSRLPILGIDFDATTRTWRSSFFNWSIKIETWYKSSVSTNIIKKHISL